jgi:hypothetical protein
MELPVIAATVALAIPHTPWIPERVKSLARLESQLGSLMGPGPIRPDWTPWGGPGRLFAGREPNWSWSEKLWTWGIETECDYLLQLQDDAIVGPDFWADLRTMLHWVPDQIIGLESVHPASRLIHDQGGSWYTTSDGLIGVGYAFPRPALIEFDHWRKTRLRAGSRQQINEDTLVNLFCLSTGRRVWHPVPTIIDHDIALASTYGNDLHTHRAPIITTVRGAKSGTWYSDSRPVPHMGRFYSGTPRACRRYVKDFHLTDLDAAMADVRRWE